MEFRNANLQIFVSPLIRQFFVSPLMGIRSAEDCLLKYIELELKLQISHRAQIS